MHQACPTTRSLWPVSTDISLFSKLLVEKTLTVLSNEADASHDPLELNFTPRTDSECMSPFFHTGDLDFMFLRSNTLTSPVPLPMATCFPRGHMSATAGRPSWEVAEVQIRDRLGSILESNTQTSPDEQAAVIKVSVRATVLTYPPNWLQSNRFTMIADSHATVLTTLSLENPAINESPISEKITKINDSEVILNQINQFSGEKRENFNSQQVVGYPIDSLNLLESGPSSNFN